MKILSIVGTRPNFVKMAPVIREILKQDIEHIFVHTGQHYDREMSQVFLRELEMPEVDHFLDVGSGSHGYQIGQMLVKLEDVILEERPDFVLVPGDTNTSLAGALTSCKVKGVGTCHIEAGLRSFDRSMPEEVNRIMIDHCADVLFCPTTTAVRNLKDEGIPDDRIRFVGDTMLEACTEHLELARKLDIPGNLQMKGDYYLVTVHRAENTDDMKKLKGIISALGELDIPIIFPVHPRTRKQLEKFEMWGNTVGSGSLRLVEPVGYLEFLFLLSNAKLMITDSGGVQKEAFILKVPCVTLRDSTEWVETLEAGANILVGADQDAIIQGVKKMLESKISYDDNPYGDGKAAQRIVDVLTI